MELGPPITERLLKKSFLILKVVCANFLCESLLRTQFTRNVMKKVCAVEALTSSDFSKSGYYLTLSISEARLVIPRCFDFLTRVTHFLTEAKVWKTFVL